MRTKKLTKKDRENLRSRKWLVFERSYIECTTFFHTLREEYRKHDYPIERRKQVTALEKRIRDAFHDEAIELGWIKSDHPRILGIPHNKARTRLSIEAV